MKLKLLALVVLFSASTLALLACGPVAIGIVKVVDEGGNLISNAKVWHWHEEDKGHQIRKTRYNQMTDEPDTTSFLVRSNVYWYSTQEWKEDETRTFGLIVEAEGFATLIINNMAFADWDSIIPTLYVTLASQKYVKQNNSITLLDKFIYNKTIIIQDSTLLAAGDYISSQRTSVSSPGDALAIAKVATWPNPVQKGITIKINYAVTVPLRAKITDAEGKYTEEFLIESPETYWDLEWKKAGSYFLTVYDEKGKPIHTQILIKI